MRRSSYEVEQEVETGAHAPGSAAPAQAPTVPDHARANGKAHDWPGFEDRFWPAYPKKKAKDDALKAWNKLRPSEELIGRMLAALDRESMSPDWRKENGQFIPYPATWLNGKRWTDEPTRQMAPPPKGGNSYRLP